MAGGGADLNAGANTGAARRRTTRSSTEWTPMAPTITNARLASHAPVTSRKPITFWGCVIPEMASPRANSTPAPNAAVLRQAPNLKDPALYLNRELSWLEFNRRVLHEALDPRTPLTETSARRALSTSTT